MLEDELSRHAVEATREQWRCEELTFDHDEHVRARSLAEHSARILKDRLVGTPVVCELECPGVLRVRGRLQPGKSPELVAGPRDDGNSSRREREFDRLRADDEAGGAVAARRAQRARADVTMTRILPVSKSQESTTRSIADSTSDDFGASIPRPSADRFSRSRCRRSAKGRRRCKRIVSNTPSPATMP